MLATLFAACARESGVVAASVYDQTLSLRRSAYVCVGVVRAIALEKRQQLRSIDAQTAMATVTSAETIAIMA